MEVEGNPGMELVVEFLKKNGLEEVERVLKEDLMEKYRGDSVSSFDYEKFLFPMVPAPPPVKILSSYGRSSGIEMRSADSSRSDEDEFVSLGSSSSEFINPYWVESHSATGVGSEVSSDDMSAFGTARDYHDFEMQDEVYWYGDKDGGGFITPRFSGLKQEPFGCPTQDKFVMTFETAKQCEKPILLGHELDISSIDYLHKPSEGVDRLQPADDYHFTEKMQFEKDAQGELQNISALDFAALCKCCAGTGGPYNQHPGDYIELRLKERERNDNPFKVAGEMPIQAYAEVQPKTSKTNYSCSKDNLRNALVGDLNSVPDLGIWVSAKDLQQIGKYGHEIVDTIDNGGESNKVDFTGVKENNTTVDELLIFDNYEDEHEVFNLRIIHRKNRTGFEENKDFPIVLNTIIAGRYYVTEYLGSAAFSKVVQAQDLIAGIDVCLKIIKNDKDFFDQSLDEIKLLKLVNKQDPADERHILRLYDYFYHQEHLFIVCELLQANLYEFQKFNQESGGEPYFTLKRLQIITRQCLEALEFLHQMGIIHCDLKPENILIKSYRRCEIKVIDLGSSCFLEDNLSLYVQSRSYRAPEVILGLPYDQKIDIWSLGCILAELCSGEVLFPNETLAMLLGRVIGMIGPIGMDMLEKGQETSKYFTEEYDLYYINEETNQPEYVIPEESSLEQHLQVSDVGFVEFVTCLLEINPRMRPTAKEALQHPWLSQRVECVFPSILVSERMHCTATIFVLYSTCFPLEILQG